MGNESDGQSSESSEGELEAALDDFLEWADRERVDPPPGGLPPADERERVATGRVLGDFELVRRLEAGGMGVIYEARQRALDRPVAVKVLRDHLPSPRLAERFRREVQTIASLEHPGIVSVVGAGVEDGTPYYAMQLVEGVSVAEIIRQMQSIGRTPDSASAVRASVKESVRRARDSSSGDFPLWEGSFHEWVARLAADVADALEFAHEHGVVHRDVKPANIMVRSSGAPVLLDFGLAREEAQDSLTTSGDFLGTLVYASPEQIRGEDAGARGDVYGLGATLYELMSLRRPFQARTRGELLREVETGVPEALGAWVPTDLRTICLCCLAKSPARRYQSAGAVARDLRAFLNGEPISARPPNVAARIGQWARRYPRVATAIVAASVAVTALLGRTLLLARNSVAQGHEHLEASRDTMALLQAGLLELREHLANTPHELETFRRTEWLREDIEERRAALARGLSDAQRAFEEGLGRLAGYGPARSGLAEVAAAELEQALFEYEDVYGTLHMQSVEERLERFDEGRWASLLDRTGSVRIHARPPGTAITILRSDEDPATTAPLFTGTDVVVLEDVAEGSYVARLSHPDRQSCIYPFLVRRTATDRDGESVPPRSLHVRLPGDEEIGDGFEPVCGGWTFVDDDPPRMEYVETFSIRRRETTYEEWVDWMNWALSTDAIGIARELSSAATPFYKPRFGESPDQWSVELRGGREWQLLDSVNPLYPVRGLKRTEVEGYVSTLNRFRRGPSETVYYALPTRAEWIRAARGADARTYPWGDEFAWERFAGFPSAGALDREPEPYPVETFPEDVSVFGVADLGGSISEFTMDSYGVLWDEALVCGGSYRTFRRGGAAVTAVRRGPNQPATDIGFRLVKRSLPESFLGDSSAESELHDTFDGHEGELPNEFWTPTRGETLVHLVRAPVPDRCRVDGGRLVCRGAEGNFSSQVAAWRKITAVGDDFVLTAILRADFSVSARAVSVVLERDFMPDRRNGVHVKIDPCGFVQLAGPFGPIGTGGWVPFEPGRDFCVELRGVSGVMEVRVWPKGSERPAEPTAWAALVGPVPVYHFLGLLVPNFAGATMEVDEVRLTRGRS